MGVNRAYGDFEGTCPKRPEGGDSRSLDQSRKGTECPQTQSGSGAKRPHKSKNLE